MPLIHGDIKPANILLDPCSHPRIGDFGLAREGSFDSMEVSRVFGTKPYLPYDFLRYRHLSTKLDTYSYGVVLFEMATSLPAYDKNRGRDGHDVGDGRNACDGRDHVYLRDYIWSFKKQKKNLLELLDKSLHPTPEALDLFNTFIEIGLKCTEELAHNRPEMVEVLGSMESFNKSNNHEEVEEEE